MNLLTVQVLTSASLPSPVCDDDDVDDAVEDGDSDLFRCSIFSKFCASDSCRWHHVNVEQISRCVFPTVAILKEYCRSLCFVCCFAFSNCWKYCRRSQCPGANAAEVR